MNLCHEHDFHELDSSADVLFAEGVDGLPEDSHTLIDGHGARGLLDTAKHNTFTVDRPVVAGDVRLLDGFVMAANDVNPDGRVALEHLMTMCTFERMRRNVRRVDVLPE